MNGSGGIPTTKEQFDMQLPIAILLMIVGHSAAGLLLTGIAYGRAGLRDLLSRLRKWQVSLRWYAIALLTAPIVLMAMLMHVTYTAAAMMFEPVAIPGVPLFIYGGVSAAVMWFIAIAVAMANRGHVSRQPLLPRQVA